MMAPYKHTNCLDSGTKSSRAESEKSTDDFSEDDMFIPKHTLFKDIAGKVWPWKAATGFFATAFLLLGAVNIIQMRSSNTISHDGPHVSLSDFPAAREAVELQEVRFTGSPAFKADGTAYVAHPGMIEYFGEPSPEVDKHWEELAGFRNFLISEEEARQLWPSDYEKHWDHRLDGYPIGLDMFHTLHCINNLRKLFHPEYYAVDEKHAMWQQQHRDHCLDHLRQYVMCAGDMTPYGTLYYDDLNYNYADTDTVHTCRNFQKLREWTTRQYHSRGNLRFSPDIEVHE